MSDFFKVFESLGTMTMEQVLAFAVLIVPGFISLRVYEMRRGGESRKANESLVDVIVYSFASDVVAFGALALVSTFVPPAAQAIAKLAVGFIGFVVLPVGVAVAWFEFRERMVRSGVVPDAASSSWDAFASTCGEGDGRRRGRAHDAGRAKDRCAPTRCGADVPCSRRRSGAR